MMSITEQPSSRTTEEYIPSLGDLLRIIWKRLWLLVLTTTVFAGASIAYGLTQTPEYEASIKILVGREQQQSDSPGSLGGDVQGLQQITQTMAEAVDSIPIAEAVIQQLNLDLTPEEFLNQHLNVEQIGATQFIQVDYRDQDPVRAEQVANAVGDEFSDQVSNVSASANAITATVWERAQVPEYPVSPNFMFIVPPAVALGLMLGVGLAFLLEYRDDSWRSLEEVEEASGVPVFGVIPAFQVVEDGMRKDKKVRG